MRPFITLVSVLLATVLLASPAQAAPPDSAPAEAQEAEIARLIRELNHPQFQKRQAAAERLMKMGAAVEEALESARPQQPAEAQAAIDQILRRIREMQRGVLVLVVTDQSQAQRKKVEAGDVFVAINDQSITDAEAWSKAEDAGLRQQKRTVRIRRDNQLIEVKFDAGRYGVFWCPYQSGWGDHLAKAARQHQAGEYAAAAAAVDEAVEAGAPVEGDNQLAAFAIRCWYYGRPVAERSAWLDELVDSGRFGNRFTALFNLSSVVVPADLHLPLQILRRLVERNPKAGWVHRTRAYRYISRADRYADGLVEALRAFQKEPDMPPADEAYVLGLIGECLNELGADDELSALLERAAAFPEGRQRYHQLFPAALRIGRLDLCEQVLPRIDDERSSDPLWGYLLAKDRLYQTWLRQGKIDQYREILTAALSELGFAGDCRYYAAYWPETGDIWARRAEQLLEDGPVMNIDSLLSALAFQVDPDLDGFEQAIKQCESMPRTRAAATFHRARLDALKGDYADSLKRYEEIRLRQKQQRPWNKPWDVEPEIEAVRFLSEYAKRLVGENEKWRRALYAFKTDDGTRYLITRDIRIGRASPGGAIVEIPLPEPGWWPHKLADGLIVSASGKTVLALSREKVYRLNPDSAGWSLLTTVPYSQRGWALHFFTPWGDELAAELEKREAGDRAIVLPAELQDLNNNPPQEPFMLADGTWFYGQEKPRQLLNLSAMVAETVGRPLRIYSCVRPTPGGPFFMATEAGLYRWDTMTDVRVPMPLPGDNPNPPVMLVNYRRPSSRGSGLFAAVLPEAGGAMFRIETKGNKLVPVADINEQLPLSYWRTRPPVGRIAEAKQVLEDAGLKWEDLLAVIAPRDGDGSAGSKP